MESNSSLKGRLLWFLNSVNQGLALAIHHNNPKQLNQTINGFRNFIAANYPDKSEQAENLITALQSVAVAIEDLLS